MDQLRPIESPNSATQQLPPAFIGNSQEVSSLVYPTPTNNPDTRTKQFSVEDMKEEPSKINIDFFSGNNPNEFVKAPTQQAKIDPASPVNGGPAYINPSPSMSGIGGIPISPAKIKEELAGTVKVVIAIIDYIVSLGALAMYQKGTQTLYTADVHQKKLLETALVEWMYEKQVKMSPGLTLFLAFMGAYGFMLMGGLKAIYERYKSKKDLNYRESTKENNMPIQKEQKKEHKQPEYKQPETFVPQTFGEHQLKQQQQNPIVTPKQMEVFQNIQPPVTPPRQPAPVLDKTYVSQRDGTVQPQNLTQPAPFVSSWYDPDPNITAENRIELDKFLARGIFPMYKMTERGKRRPRKVDYGKDGKPKLVGRRHRVR